MRGWALLLLHGAGSGCPWMFQTLQGAPSIPSALGHDCHLVSCRNPHLARESAGFYLALQGNRNVSLEGGRAAALWGGRNNHHMGEETRENNRETAPVLTKSLQRGEAGSEL